jgi:8-oxo-dGTP diphosphatase
MNRFNSGIHVLVKRGRKYLLIKRSGYKTEQEDPNCWDLPGGGIQFKEQPIKAVLRETHEETNLNVKITKVLTVFAIPYKGTWSIEIVVEGRFIAGKIKLSREHSEYKWVSKKELTAIKPKSINLLPAFKALK